MKGRAKEFSMFMFSIWLATRAKSQNWEGEKKKKKTKILRYSWLPTESCNKNVAIWNFFFPLKSVEFGPFC